jgi:tetratricopeptide (TPR) repeat protein
MVLVRLNRSSEAMPLFHKVVELDPNSPGAHLNLGIAMADQFDLNGALAEFTRAVQLDANNAQAHYNRGRALLDLQRGAEARPELEVATRLDPTLAEAWYLLGLIARQAGDTEQAVTAFRKSLAANSDSPETLYMLGQELQRKGDFRGARQMWEKAIEIRPQYSQAIYSLSRLLAKTDPEQASKLQARFEKLQSDQHIMDRAQSLGNFALASADAHDWQQAIAQLKEAIAVCGECSARPQLHKDLGLIYCHSGSLSDGRAELLEARKLAPGDQDVEKALRLLDAAQKTQ